MGLFHKLTFIDALEILDCDSLSEQQKKKVIRAESHFTEDEKTACNMLLCLHKDDGMALALLILDLINRENLPGEINAALYTHIAFRKFSEAHEKDPSKPDYIAYLALAYEHGSFCCEKDHSKAVEMAEPLRSSDATGALVKQALKDIFPEGADSAASDNKSADTPESEKANAAATADTESTSPAVPSAATVRQKEEVSLYLYPDTNTVLGKVLFSNGDIYTGEFYTDNAGRPILHGYGKMCYANGETWDGEWDENLKASLGLHTFPDGKKQAEMTRMGLTYVKDMEIEAVQKHLSEIAARTELRNQNAANYQTVTETPTAKAETKRIDFKNGSFYEGETRDGKMHGTGKYTWSDGTYYEGEFADGNFNGFGKRVYSSGGVYEGQWKDDKREGSGKYTSRQGWVYTGDFAEDEMAGYGTVIFPDGGSYEGWWQNGKRNGHGKETAAGGFIYYDGEWKDNQKHGYAVYTKEGARPSPDADYSVYKCEGSFVNGRKEGRHREFLEAFVWQQSGEGYRKCKNPGEAFDHFYRDGNCKASLKATEETKGYSVEEAERIASEQEARNLQNARDAEQRKKYAAIPYAPMQRRTLNTSHGYYDGNFRDGVRFGYGECKYDNNDAYKGMWKDGLADGVGRYEFADGAWYFGEFERGRMSGYGVYSDGNYHFGKFEDGICISETQLFQSFGSGAQWLTADNGQRVFCKPGETDRGLIYGDGFIFYMYAAGGQIYNAYLALGDSKIMMTGKGSGDKMINDPNGAVVFLNSSVSKGEMRNSNLDGRAQTVFMSGESFDGEYQNNTPTVLYHHWNMFGEEVND